MKKNIALILLLAVWLPSYSRTPKEYLESERNVYELHDDFEELRDIDEMLYWHAVDSCKQKVYRYVYDELLPGLDPTSLAYADVLLRLCPFIYSTTRHDVALQIQGIVEPIEGKSERYLNAKEYEVSSWGINAESGYWVHTFGQDTIDITIRLYKEMIDLCHSLYRPTDQRYLQFIRILTNLELYRYEDPDYRDEEQSFLIPYSCHLAALLWDDLVRWDSISEEEYLMIESGEEVISFALPELYEDERWNFVQAMRYFGGMYPEDRISFFCSNEQLVRRIAGTSSKWYCHAAEDYVDVLRDRCTRLASVGIQDTMHLMERAEEICQNVLHNANLSKDSIDYYQWRLRDFQCRMSLGEKGKKMQKEIDKLSASVRQLKDTMLMNDYLLVQSEHALLAGNEKYAVNVLKDYIKTLPRIPNMDDPSYWDIAYRLYEPIFFALARTYMIIGDYDYSRQYLAMDNDIVFEGAYGPDPGAYFVGSMLHERNDYYWYYGFPYRLTFKQPFYQHLRELCGFQLENVEAAL